MKRITRYILVVLLLTAPILVCSGMCAYVVKYKPFDRQGKLKAGLYQANAIPHLRQVAHKLSGSYPAGPLAEMPKTSPDLQALGVNFVSVHDNSNDLSGRYVWFEFGGGMNGQGVMMSENASWRPAGHYYEWEPGVYFQYTD